MKNYEYIIAFTGRKVDSGGDCFPSIVTIESSNKNSALIELHKRYEHIAHIVFLTTSPQPSGPTLDQGQ